MLKGSRGLTSATKAFGKATVLAASLLAASSMLSSANAYVRYEASISDTQAKDWSVSASKISCVLSYNINDYGRADFVLLSGSEKRLSMELFPTIDITNKSPMRIVAAPPEWRPHGTERQIGQIEVYKGFRPFIGNSVSWAMLRELSNGQRILFPYFSQHLDFHESIIPVLSPIGFSKPYDEFLECSGQLLPVGYNDVGLIALMFYEQENRLTPTSDQRLKSQIQYATLDPALSKVIISAFGSGNADNLDNIKLAKERAATIAKMFTDAGIAEDMIEINTYGDEQLATTGYTAAERQQSSKAVVELERDPFKVDRRLDVNMPDIGIMEDALYYE